MSSERAGKGTLHLRSWYELSPGALASPWAPGAANTASPTRTNRKRDRAEAGLPDEDKKPSPRETKLARSSEDTDQRKDPSQAEDMGNAITLSESAINSSSALLYSAISSPSTSPRHGKKKSKSEHPQCPICQEGMRANAPLTRFPGCRHTFHRRCMERYVEACVKERRVPIPCPLRPSDGSTLADAQAYGHLSQELQDKYDSIKEELRVASDPCLRFCRSPGCSEVLTITPAHVEAALNGGEGRTGVVCSRCHVEAVISQSAEDRDFEGVALREGYRPCPHCGVYIRSEGGCKKMTCRCGAQFCFECGLPKEAKCGCESRAHSYLPAARGPADVVESPMLDLLTPRVWLPVEEAPKAVGASAEKGVEVMEFYSPASAPFNPRRVRKTRSRRSVLQFFGLGGSSSSAKKVE